MYFLSAEDTDLGKITYGRKCLQIVVSIHLTFKSKNKINLRGRQRDFPFFSDSYIYL